MKRLHSLDSLRGIAALAVVFWHWQHFFAITGAYQHGWKEDMQPFYWTFRLFYDQGWAAVDLFFPLSGFVFFWLYGEAIRSRQIGAGEFSLLRFSRLYPLHLLTLLIVGGLQVLFWARTGDWFIYTDNSLSHFVASLLMAQQWIPPNIDQSFNGPAWSVSIEILLYILFFIAVRAGLRSGGQSLAVAGAAVALIGWNEFIARGIIGFFVGGFAYELHEQIRRRANAHAIAQAVGLLAIASWIVVIAEVYAGPLHALFYWLSGHASTQLGRLYLGWNGWLFRLLFSFIVCPLTILGLSLDEEVLGGRYKQLSPLGDISYSTYMLHFPLQLVLALVAVSLGIGTWAFEERWSMLAFFAVLIGLGALSYRYFERPLQSFVRGRARALSPAE
jgi:peptidoglycan/LPS O-acetylase OafA/YrhL